MSEAAPSNKTKNRKKGLSIFILLLIVSGILVAFYWLFFLKDIESTEDAYVGGNQIMVSGQVAGNVAKINVDNMDKVRAGDILIELDDTNAKLSFEQAQSNLANAVRQIKQLEFTVQQLQAAVNANEITLAQAQGNLNRRVQLEKSGAIDQESFQHAKESAGGQSGIVVGSSVNATTANSKRRRRRQTSLAEFATYAD